MFGAGRHGACMAQVCHGDLPEKVLHWSGCLSRVHITNAHNVPIRKISTRREHFSEGATSMTFSLLYKNLKIFEGQRIPASPVCFPCAKHCPEMFSCVIAQSPHRCHDQYHYYPILQMRAPRNKESGAPMVLSCRGRADRPVPVCYDFYLKLFKIFLNVWNHSQHHDR